MNSPFPLGKLPAAVLADLLKSNKLTDSRVLVGPGIGLDCAVLDIGSVYLVAKTDPITFATDLIGWYAVHVNANDIACSGASPRWFLATLLLPEGQADQDLAEGIFEQIVGACDSIGASLVGGHTEITYGLDRPLVMGCMLGEVDKGSLITAGGARPGDAVVVTGGVPIEATAIIAREKAAELSDSFEADFLQRCQDFLFNPGISVVGAAAAAAEAGGISAMHDPTEGGLATALWELAEASNCTLHVDMDSIPILPEGQALCQALGLDPMAAIASGALLLTTPGDNLAAVRQALADRQIPCASIGRVTDAGVPAVTFDGLTGRQPLVRPERDEVAKLFE